MAMNFNRTLDVIESKDVVVIGGGIAGVSAAVAAARNGASVRLIEKTVSLGGLATIGNVIIYLPLCDGKGNQVIGGIGEELLHLSLKGNIGIPPGISPDRGRIPECWLEDSPKTERASKRLEIGFNPASFILSLEEWVLQNKVNIFYNSSFCDVIKDGDKITHVIIMTKQGLKAIECKTVIDTTGDADICHLAGESTLALPNNVRCSWFYYTISQDVKLAPMTEPYNPNPELLPENSMGFAIDDLSGETSQVIESRKMIRNKLEAIKEENQDTPVYPVNIPTMPTFRMSRRLQKANEATSDSTQSDFSSSIGLTGDWRKSGPVHSLPFQSITAEKTSNLLVAGRCISIDNDLWDVTRVIPTCAVTGEAAGTAAAMYTQGQYNHINNLSTSELQQQLKQQKVIISDTPDSFS